MNYSDPVWMAEHCDPHDAFEMACGKMIRRLYDENVQMLKALRYIEGLALAQEFRDLPTIAEIAKNSISKTIKSPT